MRDKIIYTFFTEEELEEMTAEERTFINLFLAFPYFLGAAAFVLSVFSGIFH